MIRKRELICYKCQNTYDSGKTLFYVEDFKTTDFSRLPLVCPACIAEWEAYWEIAKAGFSEKSGNLYVNIKLANGQTHEKINCTPMDDIIAVELDIPDKAQKKLYQIYKKWHDKKMKDFLKTCTFQESFMHTSFTCETYGGKRYENIAFRFNRLGVMETQDAVPDFIKKQVVERWNAYELANMPMPDLSM